MLRIVTPPPLPTACAAAAPLTGKFPLVIPGLLAAAMTLLIAQPVSAGQSEDDIRNLKLGDWQPRTMMVERNTQPDRPAFPVVDVHNHLGDGRDIERWIGEMDAAGVYNVINLDGGNTPEQVRENIARLDQAYPGRVITFARVNFDNADVKGWSNNAAATLAACFEAGAQGLKISKALGLNHTYSDGSLVKVDDPALDAVWATCAQYNRPIMMHVSDPAAFFEPLDRYNERWHELNARPHWMFHGDPYPSRNEILEARNRVIKRHPGTIFIGAHFGNNAEDIASVAALLDQYPNFYVDIDARISELGRQPWTSRDFMIKYQDRVMFGTDTRPDREAFRIYYRFLETRDEYFDPEKSHHRQGFWMIYGIDLPDDVLRKIYYENAIKVIPALQQYRDDLKKFGEGWARF